MKFIDSLYLLVIYLRNMNVMDSLYLLVINLFVNICFILLTVFNICNILWFRNFLVLLILWCKNNRFFYLLSNIITSYVILISEINIFTADLPIIFTWNVFVPSVHLINKTYVVYCNVYLIDWRVSMEWLNYIQIEYKQKLKKFFYPLHYITELSSRTKLVFHFY